MDARALLAALRGPSLLGIILRHRVGDLRCRLGGEHTGGRGETLHAAESDVGARCRGDASARGCARRPYNGRAGHLAAISVGGEIEYPARSSAGSLICLN